jgi:hypothetical protein
VKFLPWKVVLDIGSRTSLSASVRSTLSHMQKLFALRAQADKDV